jgi:polysaccharide transporter, PST family
MKQILPLALILIERMLQLIFALLALTLLGRYLSVDDLGRFAYAQNLAAIFLGISFFAGFELLSAKFTRHPKSSGIIFTHAIYLRLFFVSITWLIASFWVNQSIQDEAIATAFQIILAGALLAEPIFVLSAWFVAQKHSIYLSIARIIGVCTRVVLLLILVSPHFFTFKPLAEIFKPIEWVAWISFFESITIATILLLSYFFYRSQITSINRLDAGHSSQKTAEKYFDWRFRPRIFKQLIKHGLLLGMSLLLNYIFLRLDRILLATELSAYDLGIYQMTMQLNDAWLNTGVVIVSMLAPIYIKPPKTVGQSKYVSGVISYQHMLFILFLIAGILGAAGIYFLAGTVIDQLLGAKYHPAIPFLQQAAWLAIPAFGSQMLSTWLLYQGNHKKYYVLMMAYFFAITTVFLGFLSLKYNLLLGLNYPNDKMQAMIYILGIAYLVICICLAFAIQRMNRRKIKSLQQ